MAKKGTFSALQQVQYRPASRHADKDFLNAYRQREADDLRVEQLKEKQQKEDEVDVIKLKDSFKLFQGKVADNAVMLRNQTGKLAEEWHSKVESGEMSEAEYTLRMQNLEHSIVTWNENGQRAIELQEKYYGLNPEDYSEGTVYDARRKSDAFFDSANSIRIDDEGNLIYTFTDENGKSRDVNPSEYYAMLEPADLTQAETNYLQKGIDAIPVDYLTMDIDGTVTKKNISDDDIYAAWETAVGTQKANLTINRIVDTQLAANGQTRENLTEAELNEIYKNAENLVKQRVVDGVWRRVGEKVRTDDKDDKKSSTYKKIESGDVKNRDYGKTVVVSAESGKTTNPIELINGIRVKTDAKGDLVIKDGSTEQIKDNLATEYAVVSRVSKLNNGEVVVKARVPNEADLQVIIDDASEMYPTDEDRNAYIQAEVAKMLSGKDFETVNIVIGEDEAEELAGQIEGLDNLLYPSAQEDEEDDRVPSEKFNDPTKTQMNLEDAYANKVITQEVIDDYLNDPEYDGWTEERIVNTLIQNGFTR